MLHERFKLLLEKIQKLIGNKKNFGVGWLLRRLKLSANTYYSYLKDRKNNYRTNRENIQKTIDEIYHETDGILGYRAMKIFLQHRGFL